MPTRHLGEPRRKACRLDGLLFYSVKPIEEARLKHDSVSGQRRRGAGYATKIHGELAELAFLFKAASPGIAVAKPYGDRLPYDFMVQCGQRLFRIQVNADLPNRTGINR